MRAISLFYGIIIRMYWNELAKHKTPHFHASYREYSAEFAFDGEVLSGKLPNKQTTLVKAWAALHEDDLKANWQLALDGEELYRIEPLR